MIGEFTNASADGGPAKSGAPNVSKAAAARAASLTAAERLKKERELVEERELQRYAALIKWLAGVLRPVLMCREEGDEDLDITYEQKRAALEQLRLLFATGIERLSIPRPDEATPYQAPIGVCHIPIEGGLVVWLDAEFSMPRVVEIDGLRYPLVCGANYFDPGLVDTRNLDPLIATGHARIIAPGVALPKMTDEQREFRRHALAAWNLRDEEPEQTPTPADESEESSSP